MKPEQHKVIAKAMGLKSHIHDLLGCRAEVNKYWVVWNPETNAEQTLMVLEWLFEKQGHGKTLLRIDFLLTSGICEDFQTAVCMAAFEYINQ